jgi:hypothetical protein
VELVIQGLIPAIKDRFISQDIENLARFVQKSSAFESRFQATKG